jgi:FtsP/CotA-like multicopper oxidase with cupredoxin domain
VKHLFLIAVLFLTAGSPAPLPIVEPNDNRVAAGQLRDGVLALDLVVTMARWYPENIGGSFAEVPVFAEVGKAPQIPAPLIRVPAGTKVRVRVRNGLSDSTLTLYGLGITVDTGPRAVQVAPGASLSLEYDAATPGTYFYAARTSSPLSEFAPETEQLAGAVVVDAPGDRTDDRILVMSIWGEVNMKDTSYREALAVNGKSWPHTERFEATVGDTLRWRVVNASMRSHPMHLHGAYFRVDALGLVDKDTLIVPELRRMVVTQDMFPRSTMRMTWSPETPGNWLFHCHLVYHVSAEARLDPPKHDEHGAMSHDPAQHMSGLINAIQVRPRPGAAEDARRNTRRLDLYAVQSSDSGDATRPRARSFLLARNGAAPADRDMHGVSDLIVVTRGEPTDITVHNRLDEATSVHWHGLELESWSDGVPGFSGQGTAMAPPVLPGGQFVARLTLKRAGTFIYHTHLNDIEQLVGGMYGPLVVLEPGQRWDPTRDFVFTGGQNRYRDSSIVVNGGHEEPPITMRVGESIRLRMIEIAVANSITYEIRRDSALVEWRAVAKDGYDLPPALATVRPARQRVGVGETFDALFTPATPGRYEFRGVRGPRLRYKRTIIVE